MPRAPFGAVLACVQTRNAAALLRCYGDEPWNRSCYGTLERARPEDRVLHAYNEWRAEVEGAEEATDLPAIKQLRKFAEHLKATPVGGSKASRKQVVAAIHAMLACGARSVDTELEDDIPVGDEDIAHDDAGI